MNKVYLIDGSSIFFRAYHAIRDLRRSDGMMTNALYGYISTLRSLIKEYKPPGMVVAFDLPVPTFRHLKYKKYKANRVAPPDDLVAQIPLIKEVTGKMGISQLECAGFEADDLIGSMARFLVEHQKEVVVVSGDKDLLQLVGPSVEMLRLAPMGKNKLYGEAEVRERYGVEPRGVVDVLALMGDASDNVPGVPGIGEKTAIALIQEFGSLDALYENLNKVSGKKRQESLRDNREMAFLSQELVTLAMDIPLELQNDFFEIQPPEVEGLRQFFAAMEFRTFLADLPEPEKKDSIPLDYQTVTNLDQLHGVIQRILEKGMCAVDTETTALDPLSARVVGISLSIKDGQGWYIPIGHTDGRNLPREKVFPLVKQILESSEIGKTGHHLKYDYHIFANEGITLRGIEDDSLIAAYLTEPQRGSHKLDDLAREELGMTMTPITDLIGTGKSQISMADVDVERVSWYACEDSDASWRLKNLYVSRIREMDLERVYQQVEVPLIEVLAVMERKGIRVDSSILRQQSEELQHELEALAHDVYQATGREFNLNSPSQLAQILYDDLKVLSGRKRSTRADILEKLAEEGVPIARQILEYRHRQKIKSTYLDALQTLIRPETGRVHTTYNQAVVNTGRISSSDPNLQNIPIRTDLGRRVRRAFVAPEGFVLISLDYSQIELRILAHISQDPGLLKAFGAGEDIHSRTAAEIFGVELADVTSDMRRKAKEINFGLNYGMSPYGLARRLGVDDREAASYIQTYFARYSLVQSYMDRTVSEAQENLFVRTLLGRRIPTPGVRDSNRMRQENARRAAINAPIQGTAADLMKKAMVEVFEELRKDEGTASILLTVHDELVLEVREDRARDVSDRCRERMEHALDLSVPIPVETSIGTHWADLK